MIIQIFRPPNDGDYLKDCKLGDICDALSLEYEPHFCGAGTFTLELPVSSVFADALCENILLYSKEDDVTFIVKNIKNDEQKITVTGYDLNGMLLDRLTMPRDTGIAGTEGKDAISGSTEACVKHFIEYNMISSPDEARNYARFAVRADGGRGITADSYLASMENLGDVVRTMCEGAGLGYRISLDTSVNSSTDPLIFFDVAERVDRSANQNDNNRVIFSSGLKNISSIERETGITAEKNALWCETGGIDGFVFKGGDAPVSWERREDYISLSVTDSYDEDEIKLFADKEFSDKFAQTDSLLIDAGNPLDYGSVYRLGDIVSVWDKKKSVQLDSVISAAHIKRTASEYSVKLTLGESKPKLLDGYAKQTDILKKNQRDFPAVQQAAGGSVVPLSEYEYLSDVAVKLNGITYTAEKDETGLILKISDSYGKELVPAVGGDITDIAFHNAVLMAATAIMGLGSVAERALFSGINGVWEFKGGLTGFTAVKAENQSYSGITDSRYLPDGSHPLALTKSYGINDSYDSYTDAVIMRSNERINLTAYSKLRVRAMVFSDYSGGLFSGMYFRAGDAAPAAESKTAYDFGNWERVELTTSYSAYDSPSTSLDKWYDVDISGVTGEQYLNFGAYHGTAVNGYTAYCYIKQIILIP